MNRPCISGIAFAAAIAAGACSSLADNPADYVQIMSSAPAVAETDVQAQLKGLTLVADDDTGQGTHRHLLRGQAGKFEIRKLAAPAESLKDCEGYFGSKDKQDATVVFGYGGLDPAASYKVELAYFSDVLRVVYLEANGVEVHPPLRIGPLRPLRCVYDLPRESLAAAGDLRLRFFPVDGPGVAVGRVRLWSANRKELAPLSGEATQDRESKRSQEPAGRVTARRSAPAAEPVPPNGMSPRPLWQADGPVEQDWARQDWVRGEPGLAFRNWRDPRWEVSNVVLPRINEQLARGRNILADLRRLGAEKIEPEVRELDRLAGRRDALVAASESDPARWRELYVAVRWAVRKLAFKNPLLQGDGLLFVRRPHQCGGDGGNNPSARRSGWRMSQQGGDICVLRRIDPRCTVEPESLTAGKLPADGVFGGVDLSFDARQIVFPFASPSLQKQWKGTLAYQVWRMGLDGDPPPTQLTAYGPMWNEPEAGWLLENAQPIYLPSGRIAFHTNRDGIRIHCGTGHQAYSLYSMNPDGTDQRRMTLSKDGDIDASVMADGTVLFTRWEYTDRSVVTGQFLWSVRPDGTNLRQVYGSDVSQPNWSSYYPISYSWNMFYYFARQAPGSSKLLCVSNPHHSERAGGALMMVDANLGRANVEGFRLLSGGSTRNWSYNFSLNYDCPYPLSEDYFLVSFAYDPAGIWGLYLMDTHGSRELIHRNAVFGSAFPMVLRPRPRPPVLSEVQPAPDVDYGEYLVLDIHRGLPESMRALARHIMVYETGAACFKFTGHSHGVLGLNYNHSTQRPLGTVPVEKDGSAYFRAPADKFLFFAALDENYQALHVMRILTNIRPGERASCVGCHEPITEAPLNVAGAQALALRRPASQIAPPPWGTANIGFETHIQPILNRHCISCHDGAAGQGKAFTLRRGGKSAYWTGPDMKDPDYSNVPSYVNLNRHLAIDKSYYAVPGTFGSRASPVMQLLAKGHYNVTLNPAEWRALCAWIDCNAPYVEDFRHVAVTDKWRLPAPPPCPESVTALPTGTAKSEASPLGTPAADAPEGTD